MKHKKLSTTELRKKNKNIVYNLFYTTNQEQTKQTIANKLNLSLPTVSQNLNELIHSGLIEYSGFSSSNGGRHARTMKIVKDAKISIGIEISKNHISFIAIDLYGNEIAYKNIHKNFRPNNEYKNYVSSSFDKFLDEFSIIKKKILGVGITLPAIINKQLNIIEHAPVLGIKQFDIKNIINNFEYPFHLINDANAGGYAECFFKKHKKNIAYLFIEKGVGGSIIINSKPYEGDTLKSAEFGHICIQPNGKKCYCGRNGCLESYCTSSVLTDDLNLTINEFYNQLLLKNQKYISIFDNYLNDLAKGINIIKMILDCDIIIGGSITTIIEPYLYILKEKVKLLDCFSDDVDYIHIGKYGNKANCIGAALYYVSEFLDTV